MYLFRRLVIGGVLIAAVISIAYAPALRIFDLRQIVISGNEHVSSVEIEQAAGFELGNSIFYPLLFQARAAILSLPRVKDVEIRRAYPHRIEIAVRERRIIARFYDRDNENISTVVEGGIVLTDVPIDQQPFLMAYGAELTRDASKLHISDTDVVRVLEAFEQESLSSGPFPLVDLRDPTNIVFYGKDNLEVRLGSVSNIESKARKLARLLSTVNLADYQTIDMRFGGDAVLVPR